MLPGLAGPPPTTMLALHQVSTLYSAATPVDLRTHCPQPVSFSDASAALLLQDAATGGQLAETTGGLSWRGRPPTHMDTPSSRSLPGCPQASRGIEHPRWAGLASRTHPGQASEQDAALGDTAAGAELVQPDAALAATLSVVVAVVPVGLGTEVRGQSWRAPPSSPVAPASPCAKASTAGRWSWLCSTWPPRSC